MAAHVFPAAQASLERLVAVLLTATVEVVAVLTVLGWLGGIYPLSVTLVDVAIAVTVWRVPALHRDGITAPPPWRGWSHHVWLLVLPAAAALVLAVAFAAGPYSIEPDTMRYHSVNAVHWLQTHGVTTLPYSEPADPSAEQPGNGELIGLFLMLPTHDDTIAYLGNIAMAVLCLVALGAGARQLGADSRLAALAGLAILLVPIIERSQLHSMSTDLVGATMLLSALAVALGLRRRRPGKVAMALLGAAIGVAMGTKYVDVVPAVLTAVAVAVVLRPWWRRGDVAVFVAATAGLSATWYVRDWVLAGNPLYPLHLALGPISLFPKVPVNLYGNLVTPLALHVLRRRWDLVAAWIRVAVYVVGPAILLTLVALLARRPSGSSRQVTTLRWLTVALLLTYAFTPFTGAGPAADSYQLAGASRFLLPALLVGVLLFVTVIPVRLALTLVGLVLLYDLDVDITGPGRPDLYLSPPRVFAGVVVVLLVVLALAAPAWWRRRPRTFSSVMATTGAAATGLALIAAALAWLRPSDQRTLVDVARTTSGRPQSAVVVMDVFDVRQVFGPRLDVPLTAVGNGPVGRQMPIADATAFSQAIEARAPVVVAVGTDGTPDPTPPGWRPPPSWRYLGMQLDAAIYVVQPPDGGAGPG